MLSGAPLAAQGRQPSPDVGDVALTPLTDLGITAKDVPEVLLRAVSDPYASEQLHTCNSLTAEILRLDAVLGDDYDAYAEGKGGIDVGRAAQGLVGSIIPFRGLVREVSGAASKERAMQAAYTAGMVRRGFLKGLGQERKCAVPARPAERPAPEPAAEPDSEAQKAGKE
ncbi:MAG: hypothetical protein ACK4IS_01585 [Erythrobacter sp.]